MAWFIGLMSGTSLDGVDAVLAETSTDGRPLQSRGHVHRPFPTALRAELLALNQPGADELHRAALAANALAAVYAEAVQALLQTHALPAQAITALGAHGQTLRHQPGLHDGVGYTLQLFNGARLAELTGIDVVCDFRSRDVAAGGQGAPLVPAFHAASFARPGQTHAVLNLGGIANVTLLHADGRVAGFDTGPANVLMDTWCQQQRGLAFDADGACAASGRVHDALLGQALADPYFALPPPKSTGRDLFDARWLSAWLAGHTNVPAADVMATLAALTATSVAQAVQRYAPDAVALHVCGGGAANAHVMGLLQAALPRVAVASTAALGVAPEQVEALAFAWLAQACLARRPGNVPAVTGAQGPRVLGAIYPAT